MTEAEADQEDEWPESCPGCGLEQENDERGGYWKWWIGEAGGFGACKRCGWTEDRRQLDEARAEVKALRNAVAQGCPPSRVRLVEDPATGPRLEVYVRNTDLRGWHWDWLQSLSRENAETWRSLLVEPITCPLCKETFLSALAEDAHDCGVARD